MWCVSTWMEENMEYQQLASTIENVFYQIFKYHWKSLYRIIAELLLSSVNVLPMSHLNNSIEVVLKWSTFLPLLVFTTIWFVFCSGEGGRENCFTYNANTSAPLCWKILIFWVFITKAVEIKGVKSLAWKSGGVNFFDKSHVCLCSASYSAPSCWETARGFNLW